MWSTLKRWLGGAPPPPPPPPEDAPAPGWDALTRAFAARYGGPEAAHWAHDGVMAMHDLRTPPEFPLDGVSAWDGGPWWHYVGFGMSELYDKRGEDPAVSGWGYELSLRLVKKGEDQPPGWPCDLLQQLCRAQWSRGTFGPNQTIAVGPMGDDTDVCGFLLAEDPDLGTLDTPHGRVTVLLLVGVDQATLDEARGGNAAVVLERLGPNGVFTRL